MCIRSYITEYCINCRVKIRDPESGGVEKCWYEVLSRGRCTERLVFKKIMVIGCEKCEANSFIYPAKEERADERREKWADDDPDHPNKGKKPKYHWKNSLPESFVRPRVSKEEWEEWLEEQAWEKEEEQRARKNAELLRKDDGFELQKIS